MKREPNGNLRLGSNVVELLVPQRRPFLMVDFVSSFAAEPVPTLEAGRHISANEPVFGGHFPGLHMWPGSLTIEGLGQTAVLLLAIVAMRRAVASEGGDPEAALEALRNLDRGFHFHPAYREDEARALVERMRTWESQIAVGTAVTMKFPRPVLAGSRLDYRIRWTDDLGDSVRFEGEASVDGASVAIGTLTGARMTRPHGPVR